MLRPHVVTFPPAQPQLSFVDPCCHYGSKGCCHTPKVHSIWHLLAQSSHSCHGARAGDCARWLASDREGEVSAGTLESGSALFSLSPPKGLMCGDRCKDLLRDPRGFRKEMVASHDHISSAVFDLHTAKALLRRAEELASHAAPRAVSRGGGHAGRLAPLDFHGPLWELDVWRAFAAKPRRQLLRRLRRCVDLDRRLPHYLRVAEGSFAVPSTPYPFGDYGTQIAKLCGGSPWKHHSDRRVELPHDAQDKTSETGIEPTVPVSLCHPWGTLNIPGGLTETERVLAVSESLCHPWGTLNIPGGLAETEIEPTVSVSPGQD